MPPARSSVTSRSPADLGEQGTDQNLATFVDDAL
jgi:hypothetical protein